MTYLFSSESVSSGHPDKIADQISDTILDACLKQDPLSKVACEVMVTSDFILLGGEITTKAQIDYEGLVRRVIQNIGYTDPSFFFDYQTPRIQVNIHEQSHDIAQGVIPQKGHLQGAGDQGLMFGYATDETEELMPLPIHLAHKLMRNLEKKRLKGTLPYLRPDAKAQVTVQYDNYKRPIRLHTIVLSTQHAEDVSNQTLRKDLIEFIQETLPHHLIDENTGFYINPTGRFVIGGPVADCGLTGRKIIVDTYGGMGRHGGGAFSGKDPSKVDRSGAYMARYIAKNIVGAKLAKECEIQLAYAIGVAQPISIKVDTFGTGIVTDRQLETVIPYAFDLTPGGIIETLDLLRPIYQPLSVGGHFGREDLELSWEKLDKVDALLDKVKSFQSVLF